MYQPTRESVASHPVPAWYDDAKLGVFVHWGLYSVPGWAPLSGELGEVLATGNWATWFANNPYAEWYMNSYRIDGSPTRLSTLIPGLTGQAGPAPVACPEVVAGGSM